MASKDTRSLIQVEWFNVTYRSVGTVVLTALLALGSIGGYWFYRFQWLPRTEAGTAIDRADNRLGEAASLGSDGQQAEIVSGARLLLDEARSEFTGRKYETARVAAIRSENLSSKAIGLARGGDRKQRMVRFYRIEGDVRVKPAGEFSWEQAKAKMTLQIGDQVKTSSSASAQLIYFDGTITTIQPGSLLEIRDLYEDPVTMVRRVREKLNWGELKASTQKRNVRGSYHEVSTEQVSARTEDAGEFRVAYHRWNKTAEVDVFDGHLTVDARSRKESLVGGERIRAGEDGRLLQKESLPGVPRLLSPSDQRVFIYEDPQKEKITLSWEGVASASRYHLMIADRALFAETLYDAERKETTAVINGVAPGSYYWRVAALSEKGVQGPFSPARRFRISSQQIRDQADTEAPDLEISDFVAIGAMVIVNGRTEPGANVWVDNEKIDVDDSGTFYAVIRLRREGFNELQFVAQDSAGNETAMNRSAYVESF
jgi:hypothetical protein